MCNHCDISKGVTRYGILHLPEMLYNCYELMLRRLVNGEWELYYDDAETEAHWAIDVNFCPMCGRPLSEPNPLTHDELRERNGKTVWVEDADKPCVYESAVVRVFTESTLSLKGDGWGLLIQNADKEPNDPRWRIFDRPPTR